jgi:hypothetical protein
VLPNQALRRLSLAVLGAQDKFAVKPPTVVGFGLYGHQYLLQLLRQVEQGLHLVMPYAPPGQKMALGTRQIRIVGQSPSRLTLIHFYVLLHLASRPSG